jgi:WD40 repeat protein
MTDINKQDRSEEQAGLKRLAWAIASSQGRFKLLVVRCNYCEWRSHLIADLQELVLPIKLDVLELKLKDRYLLHRIEQDFGERTVEALAVVGLENLENLGDFLVSLNQARDNFAVKCKFPLLLWMNDHIYKDLVRIAPDFESWSTNHQFVLPTEDLWQFLRDELAEFFDHTFAPQASGFYRRLKNTKEVRYLQRQELNFALEELGAMGEGLSSELHADLDFIEAIENHGTDQGLAYLKKCEEFWQKALEPQNCSGDCRLKLGLTRFYLGGYCLYQQKQGIAEEQQREYWQQANSLYKSSIELFQAEQRDDLVAKVITERERALQRLELWDELKAVAGEALILHEKYGSQHKLAQDYGFLAEVALAEKDYVHGKNLAKQGLDILLNHVPVEERWDTGLYYLFLGQAEKYLGNLDASLQYLETAKSLGNLGHPRIFLRILEELRAIYLEKENYLLAFQIKKLIFEEEHQYGIRSFIGAGYLSSRKQEENPFNVDQVENIAVEIVNSGRSLDVERLVIKLLGPNFCKLIVVHGLSGVGKSSLMQGGLIPALMRPNSLPGLAKNNFGHHQNVPVYVRNYENWLGKLGSAFQDAINTRLKLAVNLTDSEDILGQLRLNESRFWRTILIFDQFEEFFFSNSQLLQQEEFFKRQEFFKFISECLNLTDVRIVLSLREDYLHYLLELDRLHKIDQGILGEKNRYPLGNFSLDDAKVVIANLTGMTGSVWPADLIEVLVGDLGEKLGEVRPIELQIIGAQLQTENIKTLAEYQSKGPSERFVDRYLAAVINDCGPGNEQVAETLLYFLTAEGGLRPRKTREELEKDLRDIAQMVPTKEQLDLIFTVFLGAGLVMLLPDSPKARYQLVHDYLAVLIRRDQEPHVKYLMARLEEEKQQKEKFQYYLQITTAEAIKNSVDYFLETSKYFQAWLETLKAANFILELQDSNLPRNETMLDANLITKSKNLTIALAIQINKATNNEYNIFNILEGHSASVNSVSFSPDGEIIASASSDKTVKLWNRQGMLIHDLSGHSASVNSVSFSPDGEIIASASSDKTVKLWNRQGMLIHDLSDHLDRVINVSFSPDGEIIASASWDQTVKLWNHQGTLLNTLKDHDYYVTSISFSPDGEIIASASGDHTVKLWNHQGLLIKTLIGHNEAVTSVSFSPDGQTIASASNDKTVKLWNRQGNLLNSLYASRASNVSFSSDGDTIAFTSNDKTVKLWNRQGELLSTLNGHNDAVTSVSFSPDGETIASASEDGTVKLWNRQCKLLSTLKGYSDAGTSISFSSDGKTIAFANREGTVKLWNRQGKLLSTLTGHSDTVTSVSFSPDGETIASASNDKTVNLWNRQGKLLSTLKDHYGAVYSVSFSPDGETIASASEYATVKLWNRQGKLLSTLQDHYGAVTSVSFSPDGETIASTSEDGTVKLWNRQGKLLSTLTGHYNSEYTGYSNSLYNVSFSPDVKTIAFASREGTVKLRNREGTLLSTLKGHSDTVTSVSFSPDAKTIASGSWDKTVKLWDWQGKLLSTLNGHDSFVNSVSFSPDGETIASASNDKTVKLWNRQGKLLSTLNSHNEAVTSVSFSPDGETIASASTDNTVKLWNINLKDLQEKSCEYLHDYLVTHPEILLELSTCHNKLILEEATFYIFTQVENLVKEDRIKEALDKLHLAKQLNPQLKFAPEVEIEKMKQQFIDHNS